MPVRLSESFAGGCAGWDSHCGDGPHRQVSRLDDPRLKREPRLALVMGTRATACPTTPLPITDYVALPDGPRGRLAQRGGSRRCGVLGAAIARECCSHPSMSQATHGLRHFLGVTIFPGHYWLHRTTVLARRASRRRWPCPAIAGHLERHAAVDEPIPTSADRSVRCPVSLKPRAHGVETPKAAALSSLAATGLVHGVMAHTQQSSAGDDKLLCHCLDLTISPPPSGRRRGIPGTVRYAIIPPVMLRWLAGMSTAPQRYERAAMPNWAVFVTGCGRGSHGPVKGGHSASRHTLV
jgi:hypothetical protein